jgi:hypothetical protein
MTLAAPLWYIVLSMILAAAGAAQPYFNRGAVIAGRATVHAAQRVAGKHPGPAGLSVGVWELPNADLTPGVVASTDTHKICTTKWGKDSRHVTETMKNVAYLEYQEHKIPKVCCEVDHLISRELGGADDLKNLWPQKWDQARVKDRLENKLHQLVCAGRMPLPQAQEEIRTNWPKSYEDNVGPLPVK